MEEEKVPVVTKELYQEQKQLVQEAVDIINKLLPYARTGKHDKQDLQSIEKFCDSIKAAEEFLKKVED